MPAQTLDVSRRLPVPDPVVKAITFGRLRAAPDADDEHRNGGIPGHLQGVFFVIRATDIESKRTTSQPGKSQDTQWQVVPGLGAGGDGAGEQVLTDSDQDVKLSEEHHEFRWLAPSRLGPVRLNRAG
jgi:hypothetical protein